MGVGKKNMILCRTGPEDIAVATKYSTQISSREITIKDSLDHQLCITNATFAFNWTLQTTCFHYIRSQANPF